MHLQHTYASIFLCLYSATCIIKELIWDLPVDVGSKTEIKNPNKVWFLTSSAPNEAAGVRPDRLLGVFCRLGTPGKKMAYHRYLISQNQVSGTPSRSNRAHTSLMSKGEVLKTNHTLEQELHSHLQCERQKDSVLDVECRADLRHQTTSQCFSKSQ